MFHESNAEQWAITHWQPRYLYVQKAGGFASPSRDGFALPRESMFLFSQGQATDPTNARGLRCNFKTQTWPALFLLHRRLNALLKTLNAGHPLRRSISKLWQALQMAL
jgi:hypothetical protein